jgi:N6-adenosine-specific RNA methylase IME4
MGWDGLTPPYSTIVVDPPWHYDEVNPPKSREGYVGPSLAYSTMSLDAIRALPVGDLAEDTRLFLWVTNRYLRHAWSVVEAWGFKPGGRVLVWCKKPRCTANVTTEYILMGSKGKPNRLPWHPTTWFDWPLQSAHSQKPPQFMDLVEQWCPGPYAELFARATRLGWDSWGKGYEIGGA